MILSTNSSSRPVLLIASILLCLTGCATSGGPALSLADAIPPTAGQRLIAVLPVQNLSSTPAPLSDIRQSLMIKLKKRGIDTLDLDVLERFMARHRLRYVGGMDAQRLKLFKNEAGADALLITTLCHYSEEVPPKIALSCRLVSTEDPPAVLWMEDVGLSGDDASGLLDLGLIEAPAELNEKAVLRMSVSLLRHLSGQKPDAGSVDKPRKFWPKVIHRSPVFEPGRRYRVAVVPFWNLSERKHAGEIVALHFVRQMLDLDNFDVVEPGEVRETLLETRIMLDDGLSLANADVVFSRLNADLILTGRVFDYLDYQGPWGNPRVGFSTLLYERKSREAVWSSKSANAGDDGVFFFDMGKVNTAHAMAAEMVYHVVNMMVE